MALYDLYNIEDRLKQIDKLILRIDFDHKRTRHNIIALDPQDNGEYIAFTVPVGELDARVINDFYKIRNNKYSAFDELRAWEAKKERDDERKIEDMAHGMADLLHKPLIRDAFY